MGRVKVHVCLPNEGWLLKHHAQYVGQVVNDDLEAEVNVLRAAMKKCIDEEDVNVLDTLDAALDYESPWDLRWDFRSEKPIDNNRNKMIRDFLNNDGDFLLFMDADNPPHKNPMELIELDLDVVACPTPIYDSARVESGGYPIIFNCCDYTETGDAWVEHEPMSGLQEIDAAGSGCLLIARRVLEKFKAEGMAPFRRRWSEDGIATHGSDFEFCRRAKDLGFKIHAHYGYACHHVKEVDLLSVAQVMSARDITKVRRDNINTPEYWDGQWGGDEEKGIEARPERDYPFHEKIVAAVNGGKVLDYGCGRGDLLAKLGPEAMGCDISKAGVDICKARGLNAFVDDWSDADEGCIARADRYDMIVCTEVLEHVDDDVNLLNRFFDRTNKVIYTVPNNKLPPGMEPEHRRVYTVNDVVRSTPHFKSVECYGGYLIVTAEKESSDGQ